MAKKYTIGAGIELQGEKEFRDAISDINADLKQLDAEMKKATEEFSANSTSIEALTAKQKINAKQVEEHAEKVKVLTEGLEEVKQKYGENSTQVTRWQTNLIKAETALIKSQNSLNSLNDELKDTERSLETAGDEADNFGESIDDAKDKTISFSDIVKADFVGNILSDTFRKATSAVKEFISTGLELASDLTEVQNVVESTFGDGAQQIYEFADAAAESFGMSSLSAQEYNGTLGAMLKSMGLADESVIQMSTDLVGLAGDMASFYNLDIETAFEKIRSGISGETEPLKQLGVNLSATNLEAYALAQGIETAYSKMTEAEKATLRYNYLLEQTADAQGDFAKTSDSYANQQRVAQLQMENLAASLGEKLLPKINEVVTAFNEKLPDMEKSIEVVTDVLATLVTFVVDNHEAFISLAAAVGTFTAAMKGYAAITAAISAINTLRTANEGATLAQIALNTAMEANPVGVVVAAIAALTVALVTFAAQVDSVAGDVKALNKDFKELQGTTAQNIDDSEAEIEVLKRKMERYEELRQIYEETGEGQAELNALVSELQGLLPDTISLIDAETGAYISLAGSIDSVVESMRNKAMLDIYQEQYTELLKQQIEAEENLAEAQEKYNQVQEDSQGWGFGLSFGGGSNGASEEHKAQKVVDEAQAAIDEINAAIKECEDNLTKYGTTTAETAETAAVSVVEGARIAAEGQAEIYANATQQNAEAQAAELEAYETNLAAKIEALDKNLNLRKISEDEYYSQLKEYLDNHSNTESEAYYKQLTKYESYLESKQKATASTTAATVKTTTAAESTELKAAKSKYDELYKLYANNKITRAEYDRQYTALLQQYSDEQASIAEYAQEKMTEYAEEYAEERKKTLESELEALQSEYASALSSVQSKVESFADKITNSFEDSLEWTTKGDIYNDQVTAYQEEISDLQKQVEKWTNVYGENAAVTLMWQEKLTAAQEELENFQSNHDTTNDSEVVSVKATNHIKEAARELEEYNGLIDELKEKGIADSMLGQLSSLDTEKGKAMAEYWLSLSDSELAALNSNWEKYNAQAQKLSENLYQTEIEDAAQGYIDTINQTFGETDWSVLGVSLTDGIAEGLEAGVEGLTGSVKEIAEKITEKFKTELGIHSPSTVFRDVIGINLADGIGVGFEEEMPEINKRMANAVSTDFAADRVSKGMAKVSEVLRGMQADGNSLLNSIPKAMAYTGQILNTDKDTAQSGGGGGTVSDGITFTQYNNSPKALTRAEIYKDTKAGLQLAKAMR